MAHNVVYDGVTYVIPDTGDDNPGWGNNLTTLLDKIVSYTNNLPTLYSIGTTYPNGTPTITGPSVASGSGSIILTTMPGPLYFITFAIGVTLSTPEVFTNFNVSGISTSQPYRQAFSSGAFDSVSPTQVSINKAYCEANSGQFWVAGDTSFDSFWVNGVITLLSKPTWAN